jgi:TctA family transporter
MDLLHNPIFGFSIALSLQHLLYSFIGCFLGTLIGVLPGIGSLAAIAKLMPITFAISPLAALIIVMALPAMRGRRGDLAG